MKRPEAVIFDIDGTLIDLVGLPEPDIFEAALKKLAIAAEKAVAVGDTPYDAETAA